MKIRRVAAKILNGVDAWNTLIFLGPSVDSRCPFICVALGDEDAYLNGLNYRTVPCTQIKDMEKYIVELPEGVTPDNVKDRFDLSDALRTLSYAKKFEEARPEDKRETKSEREPSPIAENDLTLKEIAVSPCAHCGEAPEMVRKDSKVFFACKEADCDNKGEPFSGDRTAAKKWNIMQKERDILPKDGDEDDEEMD